MIKWSIVGKVSSTYSSQLIQGIAIQWLVKNSQLTKIKSEQSYWVVSRYLGLMCPYHPRWVVCSILTSVNVFGWRKWVKKVFKMISDDWKDVDFTILKKIGHFTLTPGHSNLVVYKNWTPEIWIFELENLNFSIFFILELENFKNSTDKNYHGLFDLTISSIGVVNGDALAGNNSNWKIVKNDFLGQKWAFLTPKMTQKYWKTQIPGNSSFLAVKNDWIDMLE